MDCDLTPIVFPVDPVSTVEESSTDIPTHSPKLVVQAEETKWKNIALACLIIIILIVLLIVLAIVVSVCRMKKGLPIIPCRTTQQQNGNFQGTDNIGME